MDAMDRPSLRNPADTEAWRRGLKMIAALNGHALSTTKQEYPMQDSDTFSVYWRNLDYPVYRCHKAVKAVKAFKIAHLEPMSDRGVKLCGEGDHTFVASEHWVTHHRPLVGGYVVFYQDGHISCSPPEAFESGYTPLPQAGQVVTPEEASLRNYVKATAEGLKARLPGVPQMLAQAQRNVEHDCTITAEELYAALGPRDDDTIAEVSAQADRLVRRSDSWIGGRSLATHSPSNVASVDAQGPGGAHHHYRVIPEPGVTFDICFFRGPREAVNTQPGLFEDDLLAILEDRMACFQRGEFPSSANNVALHHIKKAREALASRVAERLARGVLGKHEK